jgi:predicted dehydrogenase
MFRISLFPLLTFFAMLASAQNQDTLITLDPGHFHAGLVQKEMLPGISPTAYVYAPLGPDVTAHLNRIAGFNARKDNPTRWAVVTYAGSDYFERMLAERKGNIVVLSGRNMGKIDRIQQIVGAGMHVLGDKPWVIEAFDLPKLRAALEAAETKGVAVFDGMTQRFEITALLQKAIVNDAAIFGKPVAGTEAEPAVYVESVHYLMKSVAGVPNLRPAWFFDVRQQGEGLTDVGTHLVDLAQWTLASEQRLNPDTDIRVLAGTRWPTVLTKAEFQRVTGEREFPDYLQSVIKDGKLEYFCNNTVDYTLRGTRVKLDIRWAFEAEPGASDTEVAVYRGTRSRVEMRQGKEQNFKPEVYVVPNAGQRAVVLASLKEKIAAVQGAYPGVAVEDQGERFHLSVPETYRIGHEAHFSLLLKTFLGYVHDPKSMPGWEKNFMLAKYEVTTRGVEMARRGGKQ